MPSHFKSNVRLRFWLPTEKVWNCNGENGCWWRLFSIAHGTLCTKLYSRTLHSLLRDYLPVVGRFESVNSERCFFMYFHEHFPVWSVDPKNAEQNPRRILRRKNGLFTVVYPECNCTVHFPDYKATEQSVVNRSILYNIYLYSINVSTYTG